MSSKDIRILHEDCDPRVANDKKLPYSAYLVEYKKEDRIAYDVSIAGSQVLLFDHYYDCLLYTSPSPRDRTRSRMPSSA